MVGTGNANKSEQVRNKVATREKLIAAVGRVISRDGFRKLGINSIAREAGVNKVLIYRYFGGLPEILKAFGESYDFWPDLSELIGKSPEHLVELSPAGQMAHVLIQLARALRKRKLTLEILAWETVERNELTAILEEVRELRSIELLEYLHSLNQARLSAPESGQIQIAFQKATAIGPILAAAINYLLIRGRDIRIFGGLDIQSNAGWREIESNIEYTCYKLFGETENL